MSPSKPPIREGHCRCGRVRVKITAAPLLTLACHCTGCQRMSASAFSCTAVLPRDALEVIGETVIGGVHGEAHHHFCPYCKSWMFTRPVAAPFVNLRPTMLEDPRDFVPFVETYTSEKLPWATTPAVHSFETFPATDLFEGLMKDFAERARAGWGF